MVDPVGLVEIAVRLGVQLNTVQAWRKRGRLPEPTPTVHVGSGVGLARHRPAVARGDGT